MKIEGTPVAELPLPAPVGPSLVDVYIGMVLFDDVRCAITN